MIILPALKPFGANKTGSQSEKAQCTLLVSKGDPKIVAMQSILLFLNFSTFLIFGLNALKYANRWTVRIDGVNDEAERLARKHGFVNQGKVGSSS